MTERDFVSVVLFGAMKDLAARKGINYASPDPDLSFGTQDTYFDVESRIDHKYSFHCAYDETISGFEYFLSHTEEVHNQFMYLQPYIQDQIQRRLQELSEVSHVGLGAHAHQYLASIKYLQALGRGENVAFDAATLQSLIRCTFQTETQYMTNDRDRVITKKVIVQQKIDNQVLSEMVYGSHAQDGMQLGVGSDGVSAMLSSLDESMSYSDIEKDIPEMKGYLEFLNRDKRAGE